MEEAIQLNEMAINREKLYGIYHLGISLIGNTCGRMCMVFNAGRINAGTELATPQKTLENWGCRWGWMDKWNVEKQRALDNARHV